MMESQTAATASPHKDTLLMLIAAALFAGGLYSFYYFDPQLATTLRVLILLGSFGLAAAVGYRTETGRSVWSALTGARTELRKVIWPTRQESVQTTIMIAVVVAIMALLLWGLDSFLLYGVSKLTGRS